MIKSAKFIKTVDGEKCMKLAKILNSDDVQKFIIINKLSLNDFRMVQDCLSELWKNAVSYTFVESVAKVFKKYGFIIELDENNINYVIQ